MRVAVVGIGGTGSAALRFLAEAGHEAVGFERFRLGHDRGSSHGESRMIRYTYPDALYTGLMADAYPLWAELERLSGETLFVRCGGLYFGNRESKDVAETEAALKGAGLPYERLEPAEVHDRFPAIRLEQDEAALFQQDSGYLRSTACVLANARLAVQSGATLREDAAVTEIVSSRHEAVVRTEAGEERFDRVIVTAGAWMGQLFARLGLPFRVTRQQIVYLETPERPELYEQWRFPVWIDKSADFYGFPRDGRIEGAKLASHSQGETFDPDRTDRPLEAAAIRQAAEYAGWRFDGLGPAATHSHACLYTNTPDEDFILDRVPDQPNVWLVSGCSGHGFKMTVLLGKIAAALATGQPYHRDLSRFSLARFGSLR